jgi:hypothetical protein
MGPRFGSGRDLAIYDECNIQKDNYSEFPTSYGKNEGAEKYSLTKNKYFKVKRY